MLEFDPLNLWFIRVYLWLKGIDGFIARQKDCRRARAAVCAAGRGGFGNRRYWRVTRVYRLVSSNWIEGYPASAHQRDGNRQQPIQCCQRHGDRADDAAPCAKLAARFNARRL